MNLKIVKFPLNIKIQIITQLHENGWCGYQFHPMHRHTIYDISNYESEGHDLQAVDCVIQEYDIPCQIDHEYLQKHYDQHKEIPDYQFVSIADLSIDYAELEEISEEQLKIYKEWASGHLHFLTRQINNLKK